MCRLLGYLGDKIQLDSILLESEHSLVIQSYKPQEMTAGFLNADGFGIGWYDLGPNNNPPYSYRNLLPIWNDVNLPQLAKYIKSECCLGYVRSATSNHSVDLINCQPFSHQKLLFVHNGYIDDFRETLFRPIKDSLSDLAYKKIFGTTDSEHIFALVVDEIENNQDISLKEALHNTITRLNELAKPDNVGFSANVVLSNGKELTACRYSNRDGSDTPSLYYIKNPSNYSNAVIIASEPMFAGDWVSFPEHSIIGVKQNLEISIDSIA